MERYHIFKLGLAILFYAVYCIRPTVVNGQEVDDNETQTRKFKEEDLVFYQGVEGRPGVDFPILSHIPRTSFSCRNVDSGYYADLETDCQVFHICEENKKISFLCPNGTIFQQSELICEWWFKVNCTNSPNLYQESAEQLRENNARRKLSRRVQHHGAVMRTEQRSSISAKKNNRNFQIENRNSKKRIDNHAASYRDSSQEINNDLSRSSTSDLIRSRNKNKPSPFRNTNEENVVTSRSNRKKPIQFQAPPTTDNEDFSSRKKSRVVEHRRNSSNRQNRKQKSSPNENGSTRESTKKNQTFGFYKDVKVQVHIQQTTVRTKLRNENHRSNGHNPSEEEVGVNVGHHKISQNNLEDDNKNYNPARVVDINKNNPNSEDQNQNDQDQIFDKNQETNEFLQDRNQKQENNNVSFQQKTENIRSSLKAVPLSTTSHQTENLNFTPQQSGTTFSKNQTTSEKPKSTVPITKVDGFKSSSEQSEEAQITQETASFYKNQLNRIDQNQKSVSSYSNHRETYSELKSPKYYSTKIFSAISSVTPQYLTTQPINSGRPFIGSQVGTTLNSFGRTTNRDFSTTSIPPQLNSLFNIGRNDSTLAASSTAVPLTSTLVVPTAKFNTGRTDKSLQGLPLSALPKIKSAVNVTIPPQGSFNLGTVPSKIESSTSKILDHATVYGKFAKDLTSTLRPSTVYGKFVIDKSTSPTVENLSTTSSSTRTIISLSKSVFGGTTPNPLLQSNQQVKYSKVPTEILSTSDSYNRGDQQVRFFGKVLSNSEKPVAKLNSKEKNFQNNLNSFSTTSKPFSSTNFMNSFNLISTTPRAISPVTPLSLSTTSSDTNSLSPTFYSTLVSNINSATVPSFTTTEFPQYNTPKSFGTSSSKSGFFITRNFNNIESTKTSIVGDVVRPRPFQLSPFTDFTNKAVYTTPEYTSTVPPPTHPTYKISSASPFADPSTPEPTQPTPFTTDLPPTFINIDSMINALAGMAKQNFSDSPRPGLIIPPSAGPQTLHTLAVYFANALDGIASDKEEETTEQEDEANLTRVELEKKRLTELLTQMTMDRYNELFHEEKEEEPTTVASKFANDSDDDDNDLEGQHSKTPAEHPPKVRQLAKVFTQALSSYLEDPATFRKVLEEIRPTEPPVLDNDEGVDDELLNFSDADSKSSYPPFFPTIPSVHPTWGFLIAYNTSQDIDIKNTIGQDSENLQGADSQSFVSHFNKLQTTIKPSTQLPEDHWTSSPNVHKLWSTAFAFDPASINENFGTTEITPTTTEESTEDPELLKTHHEIKYELKALPQLELNSTQVHGILIDFMNSTKTDDDNRLQRILRKLNTTEDEFLTKMKEIESNPLTRRLILLLISECGANTTEEIDTHAVPVHTLLNSRNGKELSENKELLQTSSSVAALGTKISEPVRSSADFHTIDPSLKNNNEDTRALQLLNSLYTIASKFGK